MRVLARLELILLTQRGHMFAWSPVCFAVGVGLYFLMSREPSAVTYAAVLGLAVGSMLATLRRPGGTAAIGWALCFGSLGFCAAGLRAHAVEGPVLGWRYYGPAEGRLVGIDRSASDKLRITLDEIVLEDVPQRKTPIRIRVSLHGASPAFELLPGQRLMMTAHLSPPGGPVEPGGFDFRRHAWFQELGAVGYTRTPVLRVAPAPPGVLPVLTLRRAISARIMDVQGGDIGGFAAAVTTGDRSGVSQDALEWLRASNTAHLLAISGLHMGLLVGVVFAVLRHGLALIPLLALRWPVRKVAAGGALICASGYLALSGGNVATERAYVMAAVMLLAVMVDRRAISLRSVAIAALIVLAMRPEALLGPGFQMSFAATTALVAVYGEMQRRNLKLPGPGWLRATLGVVLSSLIAGLATAPVGAAHFNAIAHYGLLANLVSVPLMGVVVVPAAVLAVCLAPVSLDGIGLWVMGIGIRWILWVAEQVAGLDGARSFVTSPGPQVLPLIAFGALLLILWQGRARLVGVLPMIVAIWLWAGAERPAVLIAEGGSLVGVMTKEGRALSKPRGAGFVARVWLENDGAPVAQAEAAARWWDMTSGAVRMTSGDIEIVHLTTKRAAASFAECRAGQIVVSSYNVDLSGACVVYGPDKLAGLGAVALMDGQAVSSRQISGVRLWNSPLGSGRKPLDQ